jgi:prepilin-type N-terminal cleavage/methylation domain-containing protein
MPGKIQNPQSGFHSGFTLAELLICLPILAVIATFAILKVLSSQASN